MKQLELDFKIPETKRHQYFKNFLSEYWYDKLGDYLCSKVMDNNLFAKLREEYKYYTIYPSKENIFKAYAIDKPRVIILGQDPYHNGNATGRAFECGITASPSMQIVAEALDITLKEGPVLLDNWVNQGVMLLNTVLTVRKGSARSHKFLGWDNLIKATIKVLNDESHIMWLLWGKDAKSYMRYMNNPTHFVYTDIHPQAVQYDRQKDEPEGYKFNGGFHGVNDMLIRLKQKPINWNIYEYE